MDEKKFQKWFCVLRVATIGFNPVPDGKCRFCKYWCLQIRPVEEDRENRDNRYYVRVTR